MHKRSSLLRRPHFGKKFLQPIHLDRWLVIGILILGLYGLLAVFNASTVTAMRTFGDQYYFIRNQALFMGVGLALMFGLTRTNYRMWYKAAVPLLFINLVLLLAVFIPGLGVHALGAKRWINLGFTTIQPTELTKLILVIYLSAWFSFKERRRFLPFLLLLGVVVGLVILQPDLGTAVIITAISLVLYFLSGAPIKHFLLLVPVIFVGILLLAIVAPYRMARLTTFLNPNTDPLGSSYHIRQILIALGSGGWFGVGIGKSRQKYEYLPEANTDSIFAIMAEEMGVFGGLLFIGLCLFIIYRSFRVARAAPDRFGNLLASGIATWFGIQTLINVAAMVALVPLTGVPLPLISYGGSNLVAILIGFGILLSISKTTKTKA